MDPLRLAVMTLLCWAFHSNLLLYPSVVPLIFYTQLDFKFIARLTINIYTTIKPIDR